MSDERIWEGFRNPVLIRLHTLVTLRWLAIIGQLLAVVVVAFALGFAFPWYICLALIGFSAILNMSLAARSRRNHHLAGDEIFLLLVFDVLQLGVLLFVTGGLINPFVILLMAPVIVSATLLSMRHTVVLGCAVVAIITTLAFTPFSLPWFGGRVIAMPPLLLAGTWLAIVSTLAFTAIYAFRVAAEARKLAEALAATELVMQREQHLTALDGLAAAAAHELGTPLSTISVIAKEMVHALAPESAMAEDAQLLRSQAERCRQILGKLSSLPMQDEAVMTRMRLDGLIEEVVAPLRGFGPGISIDVRDEGAHPLIMARNPGILYGLGNLVDNAVDFANAIVTVSAVADDEMVRITVRDDGPGYPLDVLSRLGEPFLTRRKNRDPDDQKGLGLGLFIAKTLLERSGAVVTFDNGLKEDVRSGARIHVTWPRGRLQLEQQD